MPQVQAGLSDVTPPPPDTWERWFSRLDDCLSLTEGWNGYAAPAPNEQSVRNARCFLEALQDAECEPTRIAPSAMGGIAITRKSGDRKVFVEFYNDARAYALFSDRTSNDMRVEPLNIDPSSISSFLVAMRDYLNG